MTKTLYTVTSPLTGKVHTRNSTKAYTHAVIATMKHWDGGRLVDSVQFCGSLVLAQKAEQSDRTLPGLVGITIVSL